MNRRERSAATASGQDSDPPENYVRTIKRMAMDLRVWLEMFPEDPPRFALPDRKINAIAPLDAVIDRIVRNEAARGIAERFCEIGVEDGGPGAEPTLHMLRVVLDLVDVPWEVVSLAELGEWKVLSPGDGGEPS